MSRLIPWMTPMAVCGLAAAALGQAEPFTYQGQLKQQGVPLTELVDMRFRLFDSDNAETPVAGPIVFDGLGSNLTPVQVVNGLFSVELDFGLEALQQGGRWLEIEVRSPHDPTDGGAYALLTPRQHLTAAPFALSVPGLATSVAGVEIAGDMHAIGQIAASAYTSNSPLVFKVNPLNMECARFEDAQCFLGLGTTEPQARLHVGGVAGVDGIMFPDGSMQTTAAGLGGGDGYWSPSGTNVFSNNGGNVGIGTTEPHHRLRIGGGPLWTSNQWTGSLELDNASAIGWRSNAAGRRFGIGQSGGGLYFFHTVSDPGTTGSPAIYDMFISDAGNVNIGSGATPSNARLNIAASGEGAELLRFDTERPWVFRQVRTGPSASLQLLSTTGQKRFEITAVAGENVATFFADGPNSRVGIGTTDPISRLDIAAQDALGITGFQPFLTLRDSNAANARGRIQGANGNMYFYTEPSFATGIAPLAVGEGGNAVRATHSGGTSTAAVLGLSTTFNGNGVIGEAHAGSQAYGVWGRSANGIGGYFTGGTYALIADGRARVDILEIAGADVAEKFLSSDAGVEAGTVMEIDPEHPGQLRIAREAYSTRVAGVVSGAGDIPVGAVLGNLPGHENAPAIALSGRVWVRCDASRASIAPGDMLTTSDTSGHAMKAVERDRAYGTILGKSMTALAQGERGLVLVLVNLQ